MANNTAFFHIELTCKYCGARFTSEMEEWVAYGDPVFVCCPKCPVMVRINMPFPGQALGEQEVIADRRAGGVERY